LRINSGREVCGGGGTVKVVEKWVMGRPVSFNQLQDTIQPDTGSSTSDATPATRKAAGVFGRIFLGFTSLTTDGLAFAFVRRVFAAGLERVFRRETFFLARGLRMTFFFLYINF
jgi:hypothetical protein